MVCRALILLSSCYRNADMASSVAGQVASISVANDNYAILYSLNNPIKDPPRCNESHRFSIHLKKSGGIASYMTLLEARQQGYTVTVVGLNHCSNEWKSEDVTTLTIN